MAVLNNQVLLFWGWPLCTKTTYKYLGMYHRLPTITRMYQNYMPVFKAGFAQPYIEVEFLDKAIHQIDLGCGYLGILDDKGRVYMWGDNYAGQLGQNDEVHRENPVLVKSLTESVITQVSLGFQHVLALDNIGNVYGIGKNDRYQLGEEKKKKDEGDEVVGKFGDPIIIKGFNPFDKEKGISVAENEAISQVAAGKFHSLFLSESQRIYSLGDNRYGQLGLSNQIIQSAMFPVEIPAEGMKIKQISAGNHHNLVLSEEGKVYAFGSNLLGQVTGKQSQANYNYLHEIKFPSDSKAVKVHASNLRSCAFLENGEVWFWGGYFYEGTKRMVIDDFNLLNEEDGLHSNVKIVDYQMGFGHDVVMTEINENQPVEIDEEKQEQVVPGTI